ncbi:MAG: 30S ribosome-binding factor RbfA [Candidatus Omnitrophica bacterium]|nr:30S ribosome-binding factor RbfA [Candidatus Omnitrophota bacterium]
MGQERTQRVAEQIKKVIGGIIHDDLGDPRIGFVTVTKVELSRDLRVAKVYFSLLGSEKQLRDTKIGLKRSSGFIRKLLGERIKLRYTPEIIFKVDAGIEHSIHISEILSNLQEKRESNGRK